VLSKRLLAADESFGLIKGIFAPGGLAVKADPIVGAAALWKAVRSPLKVDNKFLRKTWRVRA
jgi:hypothetical protein